MINLSRLKSLNKHSSLFRRSEYIFNVDFWDSEVECFDSLNKTSETNREQGTPTPIIVGNDLSLCYE